MSNCILYVGGLAEATSDCQLRDLFGAYGAVVHVHVIRHKHSGKSAGYGFVEMGSGEQARHAVSWYPDWSLQPEPTRYSFFLQISTVASI
ncbi:MAG: RNA-binding protein [Nitrospirae bacterium]|nr:RNA-binding protein [Nitrospirota bacterium]